MIAIGRGDYYIGLNFKESLLIRILLRCFCLDYYGGKIWPHLLLYALVYKNPLFCDNKIAITPLIMGLGQQPTRGGTVRCHQHLQIVVNSFLKTVQRFFQLWVSSQRLN